VTDAENKRDELLLELARLKRRIADVETELGIGSSSRVLPHASAPTPISEHSLAAWQLLEDYGMDFFSVHAANGDYLYASPNCQRLFGWSADQLVGQSAYQFFHQEDLAEIARDHAAHDRSASRGVRYRLQCGDGSYRWVETRSAPHRSDQGVEQIVCVTRDVHEQRKAEEQVATATQLLQRTQQATLVGNLIGVYSHELNNPLAAAMGLLDEAMAIGEVGQLGHAIQQALMRIRDTLRELLLLLDEPSDEPEVVDLPSCIRRIADLLTTGANRTLRAELEPAAVVADKQRLCHALYNVLVAHLHGTQGTAGPFDLPLAVACRAEAGLAMVEVASHSTKPLEVMRADVLAVVRGGEFMTGVPLKLAAKIVTELGGHLVTQAKPGGGLLTRISLGLAPAALSRDR
jgi:PAS domain S-box-containing protein